MSEVLSWIKFSKPSFKSELNKPRMIWFKHHCGNLNSVDTPSIILWVNNFYSGYKIFIFTFSYNGHSTSQGKKIFKKHTFHITDLKSTNISEGPILISIVYQKYFSRMVFKIPSYLWYGIIISTSLISK